MSVSASEYRCEMKGVSTWHVHVRCISITCVSSRLLSDLIDDGWVILLQRYSIPENYVNIKLVIDDTLRQNGRDGSVTRNLTQDCLFTSRLNASMLIPQARRSTLSCLSLYITENSDWPFCDEMLHWQLRFQNTFKRLDSYPMSFPTSLR